MKMDISIDDNAIKKRIHITDPQKPLFSYRI
jgi:hypothetical protein